MNHLTDEQFEDILRGAPVPDHINECAECCARLAEKRALAARARKAFASVHASPQLASRIRANLKQGAHDLIQSKAYRLWQLGGHASGRQENWADATAVNLTAVGGRFDSAEITSAAIGNALNISNVLED